MILVLLSALAMLQVNSPEQFAAYCDLQGIYDQINQMALSAHGAADLDTLHSVLYSPDWVFVDAGGHRHTWDDMRAQAVQRLELPPLGSVTQTIRNFSLLPDGANVIVSLVTESAFRDEPRQGQPGKAHKRFEVTTFRDVWAKSSDRWRMTSRTQTGKALVWIDKRPPQAAIPLHVPKCPQ